MKLTLEITSLDEGAPLGQLRWTDGVASVVSAIDDDMRLALDEWIGSGLQEFVGIGLDQDLRITESGAFEFLPRLLCYLARRSPTNPRLVANVSSVMDSVAVLDAILRAIGDVPNFKIKLDYVDGKLTLSKDVPDSIYDSRGVELGVAGYYSICLGTPATVARPLQYFVDVQQSQPASDPQFELNAYSADSMSIGLAPGSGQRAA